jgi:pyruvate formate lyase activating enzyme
MAVQCKICPKSCVIKDGESGECRVRVNIDDRLVGVTYGHPCAVHIDPIEKKPLFHMLPGSRVLSIATSGCNLHCKNCQNWQISQQNPEDGTAYNLLPDGVAELAKKQNCPAVAYTYTEPVVYYEYTLESSIAAKEQGLKNILVTAAYVNPKPWRELCQYTDAANIDLKFMSDKLYKEICDASVGPVLRALVEAKKSGVMVEVTNLVIPTLNDSDDDFKKLSRWIKENMGKETPLHFSAFFPTYRLVNLPVTPAATLARASDIARAEGLNFVYTRNVADSGGENTYCPECEKLLVKRAGYSILQNNISGDSCSFCGRKIYGIWQ